MPPTAEYVGQGEDVPRTCCSDHAFQDRLRIERAAIADLIP